MIGVRLSVEIAARESQNASINKTKKIQIVIIAGSSDIKNSDIVVVYYLWINGYEVR